MTVELRYLPLSASVVQKLSGLPTIVGYAAVFNSSSNELTFKDGRKFREVIRRGAFAESLNAKSDVIARLNHDEILGRVSNGTLRLLEDSHGLRYEIDPPDTTTGRDAVELIRRRDVPYSSFAFTVRKGGETWKRIGGILARELTSLELRDVSPVTVPAYPATEAVLRSFEASLIGNRHSQTADWHRRRMRLELAERG